MRWNIHPSFFTVFNNEAAFEAVMMSAGKLMPLYVELRHGGPFGEYLFMMLDRPARVMALAVQLTGTPNPIPCRSCIRRFQKSESNSRFRIWPFFGCRSTNLLQSGACGNCVYSVGQPDCEYHVGNAKYAHLHTAATRKNRNEDLNERNSPRKFLIQADQMEIITRHLMYPLVDPPIGR